MLILPKFDLRDFSLTSETAHDNAFGVELTATFEHESGHKIEHLPGVYNGDGEWIVRFSPTHEGIWRGETSSDDPALDGIALEDIQCVENENADVHGRLQIDAQHPHKFSWEDGKPFVILGFEFDWMFSYHQRDAERCYQHIDLIAERGFNTIVTNVYAHTGFSTPKAQGRWVLEAPLPDAADVYGPPQQYIFGGSNETPDHSRLNTAFFQDFDRLMTYLHDKGILVHLMLQVQNKHVNWPKRRSAEDDAYWRYVVARYQAFGNIIWDIGKESYNLLHETGSHDYTINRMALIRENDAYDHLVTVHDAEADSRGRYCEADQAADLYADQAHTGDTDSYNREAILTLRRLSKPYLNIEYGYERGADKLKTFEGRTTASWQDVLKWSYAIHLAGAHTCYYYSNTAWDLVKFEPEPPGWQRYRYLRDVLDAIPFNQMTPCNQLVARGYCLADPGHVYLVYLPQGGDAVIDLSDVPFKKGTRGQLDIFEAQVESEWMDIFTGERRQVEVTPQGWDTRIENPFDDADQPCITIITVPSPTD